MDLRSEVLRDAAGRFVAKVFDSRGRLIGQQRFSTQRAAQNWAAGQLRAAVSKEVRDGLNDSFARAARGNPNMSVQRTSRGPKITFKF